MDLAYVDKLAKDNKGVKCLLARQYLFDRTVDAKRMETEDSKETICAFLTSITKKNCPKRIWVDKVTEFARIQVHSQIDSIRYNTKLSLDRLDTKECKEFRLFVHSVQQTTTRI